MQNVERSLADVSGCDLDWNCVEETVLRLFPQGELHKTAFECGGLVEHCIVHDLIIAELLDGFDLGAMRLITSTILDPVLKKLARIAIAVILERVLGWLFQTNAAERRISALAIQDVLVCDSGVNSAPSLDPPTFRCQLLPMNQSAITNLRPRLRCSEARSRSL